MKQNHQKYVFFTFSKAYSHAKTHATWPQLQGLNNEHMKRATNVSFENILMENCFKISLNLSMTNDFNQGVTLRNCYVNIGK